jgi:hypothetical protein
MDLLWETSCTKHDRGMTSRHRISSMTARTVFVDYTASMPVSVGWAESELANEAMDAIP